MKFILSTLIISVISCSSSQPLNSSNRLTKPAKITDWGGTTFIFSPNYWADKGEVIIKQLGETEFENVKKFSERKNMPGQMLIFSQGRKKDTKTHYAKMSELKQFQIATYEEFKTDGVTKIQKSVILVPYKGNENWDSTAKWDKVYFIINSEFVDVLKGSH